MINCRRPSNRSSKLALPLGPSNSYFFSTASHGIRRRLAASASRARVNSFSFTSSCWRAASHSCGETIGGVFIVMSSFSVQVQCSCATPGFSSGRQPLLVFLLQARPAVPEWLRLLAGRARDQDVEVHVPAGSDLEQGFAARQAPMSHGEQHLVALWFQLEGHVAAALPGEGELAGWIELGDPALHSVLIAEARRPLAGRIGQLVIAPDKFEWRTDLQLHLARRQPLATQFAVRQIRPDALDGPGHKALNLQRGGLNQSTIGVRRRAFAHYLLPFLRAKARLDVRDFLECSFGTDDLRAASRRIRSSTSRCSVQKR